MDLFSIYSCMPTWFQNVLCSIKGGIIHLRRYDSNFHKELSNYQNQCFNQSDELINMLYSARNMEPYKAYLQDIDWAKLRTTPNEVYNIIAKFPIIDKKIVKANISSYTNHSFLGKYFEMRTSGTTGAGLAFPYSNEMENKQWAIWWRYRNNLGIKFDTWCGWFGGKEVVPRTSTKSPFWRINYPGRQIMFSAFHLTSENVKLYYDCISKRHLSWLHGYPSHIAKFASLMVNANLQPLKDVKFVTTGAENVIGNQLLMMKKAFPNAIIRQHYGLNEGVANISQDKSGEWIVDDDFCYIEFIPVSEDNKTICRIIGTGFSNLAFPLIRYDTGDLATIEYDHNGNIAKIVSIDGRSSNIVRQASGHDICEASLSIVLHDFDNILEAQFHQKSINDIELWVVRGKDYNDMDEQELYKSLAKVFDKDMRINLKYVELVERTKAGKIKIVIDEIN